MARATRAHGDRVAPLQRREACHNAASLVFPCEWGAKAGTNYTWSRGVASGRCELRTECSAPIESTIGARAASCISIVTA